MCRAALVGTQQACKARETHLLVANALSRALESLRSACVQTSLFQAIAFCQSMEIGHMMDVLQALSSECTSWPLRKSP